MTVTLAQRVRLYQEATAELDRRRAELYTAIREAHADGVSLRAIAQETGLSFGRIHQIVRG